MERKKDIGYIVPHTHWDREWRYPVWQGRMMLVQFMQELLDILDTDPDYKSFVMDGQSVIIEDYLQIKPGDRERVTKHIKDGRISIGPWYTLPDLYPVDGECLVRNLLKGLRYSKSVGGYMKVGYTSFGWGQTAQFPQIYKSFGFDVIVTAKNVSKDRAPSSEFLWESPDGTKVLTTRLGEHARANFYMNAYIAIKHGVDYLSENYRYSFEKSGPAYHQTGEQNFFQDHFIYGKSSNIYKEKMIETIKKAWDGTDETILKSHRILMDGSDFSMPQRELTRIISQANELFEDKEFRHGTLEDYTNKLKELVDYKKLKLVKGELRDGPASSCSSNALTTRSYIKQLNKKAQNSLLNYAEPLSTMASLLGVEYQKEFIDLAIKNMLLSQAHDSINGVTQDKTANDTTNRLDQALEIGEVVSNRACVELIKHIDLSHFEKEDILLAIFNPLPSIYKDIIKVYVDIPQEDNIWDFDITDCDGNKIEKQFVSRQETTVPVHDPDSRPWPLYADRYCLYLDTGNVPSCGYKVLKVVPTDRFNRKTVFWSQMRKNSGDDISTSSNVMQNEYLKVKVEYNGTITLLDKSTEKLYYNLNYFEDTGDCGDYWVYYPPYNNKTYTSQGCPARIWLEDNGPLSATIGTEIKMKVPAYAHKPVNAIRGESKRSDEEKELTITCKYTLKKNSKRVDVSLTITNTAEDHRLKLMFDTGINADYSDAAGHFTVDKRPVLPIKDKEGEYFPEMQTLPMQSFVDISDGNTGFAVLSNCFSEFEVIDKEDGMLAITLFRSVRNVICSEFRSAGAFPHEKGGQSLGEQKYDYSIDVHKGDWCEAKVYSEAERFNIPSKVFQTSKHLMGTLPLEHSFISITPSNLIMSALKKCEDRDSIILRVYNPTSSPIQGEIDIYPAIKEAYFTNLNEERSEQAMVNKESKIQIEIKSNKIVTLEVVVKDSGDKVI